MECHSDDTPLTFHDTLVFSLLILLAHVSKFNIYDTPTEIGLTRLNHAPNNLISTTLISCLATSQCNSGDQKYIY